MPLPEEPKTLISPTILRFFGYAEEQAIRTVAMKGRLRAFNVCVTEVSKAFDSLAELEKAAGLVYSNLATVFVTDANEIAGSLQTMGKVRDGASQIATEQAEFARALARSAAQLGSLRDGQVYASKSWGASCDKAFAAVEKTRIATVNAVRKFEIDRQSLPSGMDPWLIDQVLRNQINRAIAAENAYQNEMASLGQKMFDTEAALVEKLQKIFAEHHALKKLHSNNVLLHFSTVATFLGSLAPTAPFETFNRKHDVLQTIAFSTARTIPDFPFTIPTSRVIKEGHLARPGGGFWKSSFTDGWGVISDKGFFHLFTHSRPNMVTRAIGYVETKKWETMDAVETLVSVQLRKGKVEVGIPIPSELLASAGTSNVQGMLDKVIKQGEDHLFELTIKAGSDLGDPKEDVKHLLKCETEEEMVDWITAIKRALESVPGARSGGQTSPVAVVASSSVRGSPASERSERSLQNQATAAPVLSARPSSNASPSRRDELATRTSGMRIGTNEDLLGSIEGSTVESDSPTITRNPWTASSNPGRMLPPSTTATENTNLFVEEELDDDFFSDSFSGPANQGTNGSQQQSSGFAEFEDFADFAPPSAATCTQPANAPETSWEADFS